MSKALFNESDDNSENEFELKTNKDFAKTYNQLRKKELLQKFNNKGYGASESETSSDSDSSEEDEVLDPTFDQEFLKTLASLKSKDPTIYDKNKQFFEKLNKETQEHDDESPNNGNEEETNRSKKRAKKTKPVTLKDYERKIILEKEGKFEDDSDEENTTSKNPFRSESPTMVEEEQRLKAEFQNVMEQNDSSDEEFGGIFKKRDKSKAEQDKEEEDYLKWLAGKDEAIDEEAKEKLKPLKSYWNNEKLPSSEKFLRDYILNKGYTEANNYSEIPTYEEIVGDNAPLSEDEQELEKQAQFEQKYNFRFEDPDQEFIKRYPRTVESSVRISDDKRKQKRQEIKERKLREKEEKMKELEMVKEMKRKEIEEKIEKLKMVTGNDELGFNNDDLEEDFDPEAHDRRMQQLFNDDYYQYDEGEEKPECPSDIEELKVEDWDNYDPQKEWNSEAGEEFTPHCEDDDFIMDCDYDPAKAKEELQKELIEHTRKRKGRKGRRDRFMEIIKTEKPVFDPEDEKTYGEYIDEYYKLDCEDIIGDTPCRFKYVETTPNDFGLTIDEILLAKNKELNQWASLKKAVQIRPDYVEKKEQRMYKLKAKNEDLKRKIFKSLYGEGSDNENEEDNVPNEDELQPEIIVQEDENNTETEKSLSKNAKKKRKRKAAKVQATDDVKGTANVSSNGVNTQSEVQCESKKPKIADITETKSACDPNKTETTSDNSEIKKKKKNRKKKKDQSMEAIPSNEPINKPNENVNSAKSGNYQGTKGEENKPQSESPETSKIGKIASNKSATNKQLKQFQRKHGEKIQIRAPSKFAKSNPFTNNRNSSTNVKNKFKTSSDVSIGSMPPLRQNKAKQISFSSKPNFVKNKTAAKFHKKTPGDGGDTISDERLKAYGVNPKKFHKKQKYGNNADNVQKQS